MRRVGTFAQFTIAAEVMDETEWVRNKYLRLTHISTDESCPLTYCLPQALAWQGFRLPLFDARSDFIAKCDLVGRRRVRPGITSSLQKCDLLWLFLVFFALEVEQEFMKECLVPEFPMSEESAQLGAPTPCTHCLQLPLNSDGTYKIERITFRCIRRSLPARLTSAMREQTKNRK